MVLLLHPKLFGLIFIHQMVEENEEDIAFDAKIEELSARIA